MKKEITRRALLRAGASAAVSATVSPLVGTELPQQKTSAPASGASADLASKRSDDLCFMPATEMSSLIRKKKLSAREVMQAHLRQIELVNSKVNAIVTLVPEDRLMAQALAADESLAKGKWLGPLHGLPIGVKDLHETKGIRTTYGSPLKKDFVTDFD
jgi:amidase